MKANVERSLGLLGDRKSFKTSSSLLSILDLGGEMVSWLLLLLTHYRPTVPVESRTIVGIPPGLATNSSAHPAVIAPALCYYVVQIVLIFHSIFSGGEK